MATEGIFVILTAGGIFVILKSRAFLFFWAQGLFSHQFKYNSKLVNTPIFFF
jgi:hypothetical protein